MESGFGNVAGLVSAHNRLPAQLSRAAWPNSVKKPAAGVCHTVVPLSCISLDPSSMINRR